MKSSMTLGQNTFIKNRYELDNPSNDLLQEYLISVVAIVPTKQSLKINCNLHSLHQAFYAIYHS